MHRRRDRARPPGPRADQGPADPHGAQLRRPRPGDGRRSAARPASRRPARITLNAYHEGGHIIIEITDDGRGLADRQDQGRRSCRTASPPRPSWPPMSEQQIQQYHLQGRLLHRRQGHQRLRPRRRHGRGQDQHREDRRHRSRCARRWARAPTFIIKIPLTLAIVSALIVECASERFAIPQISVVELVRATANGELQDRADQGHAGPAPAQPPAAAGLAAQAAEARHGADAKSEDDTFIVVTQVGTYTLRHHRRPRVRHRGNRGQAGGADPARHRRCSPATRSSATAASS